MNQSNELSSPELDNLSVKAFGLLAVDIVQKANSGHPGLPEEFTVEDVWCQASEQLRQHQEKS